MARARAASRALRDERGFTLIELLVTMVVTAVGVIAVISTFDYSRNLVTQSEMNSVASHYAEAAVEKLQARDFTVLALTSNLTPSTDPATPDYYVQPGGASYQWDQGSTGPRIDPLVVDAAQGVVQHISTWTDPQSRLSGSIYRYVTSVNGTSGQAKRVSVAVTVNGGGLKKPVLISSVITNPKAGTG
jgi:prepilin-type N-terminal cleavage/methylation domain-containing protein